MGKGEHDEGKPYDYSPNVDKEKMGVLGRKWYESQIETYDRDGKNIWDKILDGVGAVIAAPAEMIKEKMDAVKGPEYPWYHRKYRRVPTIDECYMDDIVCREEANMQYQRDKIVDFRIVNILSKRYTDCQVYYRPVTDHAMNSPCVPLWHTWNKAQINYYTKYGDTPLQARAEDILMKQKHRMIYERRYGKYEMTPEMKETLQKDAEKLGFQTKTIKGRPVESKDNEGLPIGQW